ncbi:MAG: hypothetical protein CL782_06380 [Chloroflexi bacterium]|nr:hypothetical protein [Chloroflexota bacterium]|tara:strand:+ start:5878 stop:6333 length:456 start_codon:yes stop_codon:yes gene_type:complete
MTSKSIICWITALPASLASAVLIRLPVEFVLRQIYSILSNTLFGFGPSVSDFIAFETALRITNGLAVPVVSIYVLYKILPNYKVFFSFVLAGIYFGYLGIVLILVILNNGYYCIFPSVCIGHYSGLSWIEIPFQLIVLFIILANMYGKASD